MNHSIKSVLLSAAVCLFPLTGFAQDPPDFSGTWSLKSDPVVKLVFAQSGEKLELKEMKGSDVLSDFSCTTRGKDCTGKDEGQEITISMWFNGSRLVMMETNKDKVTRRRYDLSKDGASLHVEVTAIDSGKTEEQTFVRAGQASGPA